MKKIIKIALLSVMSVIVVILAIATYFNVSFAKKIFPNVTINGKDYSGLTKDKARENLENEIKNAYNKGIVFTYKDKTYKTEIDKAGIAINAEKTAEEAFNYGHDANILQNIMDQFSLVNGKKDFKIEVSLDDSKLESFIQENMSKIEEPPRNFGYKYSKGIFNPQVAKSGVVIDRDRMKNDIGGNLSVLKNDTIGIVLVKKEPEVSVDLNNAAVAQAYNALNKKITLKYGANSWEIPKDDLAAWISFVPVNDQDKKALGIGANIEKIDDFLITLVSQINVAPVNAELGLKEGKVEVFALSEDGIALQIEKSAAEIDKAVFIPENYKDSSEKIMEVQLLTEKVHPEITTESIDNMGITALLATGESDFAGSPKNRKHNISVGASKFQGILIGPGDEFSFNKILGNVGPKEGYLPELVIKQGKTIPEYGGGVCQVSTTVFRAAVLAGLEITERRNHAYAVKYYNPQGMDATIYPPSPDLKFKNNTPAYILIQTRIEGTKLYFDFYGSSDGRKVVAGQPKVYDKKADGSMKADWTQEVYDKDGNEILKKTFHSVYKSPALYPKTNPLE